MVRLSLTEGNEIANIYKTGDETLVTKLKINSELDDKPIDEVSRKDPNLTIIDNVFTLPKGYTMRLSPTHDLNQNFRMVCIGISGSGKSTFAKNFILDYRKKYPKKDIFLFSKHDSDPSIDQANPTRIQITESEVAESIKTRRPLFENKNLAKSLVIFDDTFSSQSPLLTRFWDVLAMDLYQNGRKIDIDLLFIMHNTNYSKTRILMSEATHYIFFMRRNSKAMFNRLLDKYIGIEDKQSRKKLFNLPSRYIIFSNTSPMYILTETQCFDPDYFEP